MTTRPDTTTTWRLEVIRAGDGSALHYGYRSEDEEREFVCLICNRDESIPILAAREAALTEAQAGRDEAIRKRDIWEQDFIRMTKAASGFEDRYNKADKRAVAAEAEVARLRTACERIVKLLPSAPEGARLLAQAVLLPNKEGEGKGG